ncbi:Hypothetical predicted protein, partial [Mytilus galloprovincialis]
DLRLVGGNNPEEGRLEIYHNSQWGTVCDDHFNTSDAVVACRQLGKRISTSTFYTAGGGTDPIWLDDMGCDVDGIWGSWNIWSVCNATCGGGMKKRTRNCNNPCPSDGGSTCLGIADETLLFAESNCPVNGDWSDWLVWSVCSSSCGSGIRKRTRLCDNPTPSYDGRLCNGNTLDLDSCNTHECPVDGDWSGWSFWNTCSATCNGGIQDRNRKCDDPQPSNGGISCKGTPIESRPCLILDCEIVGQWGTWQEWEVCNTTCGNGTQQRLRKCDSPSPYFNGSECMGLDIDIQPCYQGICLDIQIQPKEDIPNLVSPVILGIVAAVCIVVTAVITCIALFVFRKFRPEERMINGSNTENLLELRVTSQQNDYDCDEPNDLYDTCNDESIVSVNTQIAADNIETGANAKIPCNDDSGDEVYENLKIA